MNWKNIRKYGALYVFGGLIAIGAWHISDLEKRVEKLERGPKTTSQEIKFIDETTSQDIEENLKRTEQALSRLYVQRTHPPFSENGIKASPDFQYLKESSGLIVDEQLINAITRYWEVNSEWLFAAEVGNSEERERLDKQRDHIIKYLSRYK